MKAQYTGKNTIHLAKVISTNSYTAELLSNSEPLAEGSVIMADFQSGGRGQSGDVWESKPELNLLLTVFYRPHFLKIEDQFLLSIAISLAVCEFLEKYVSNVQVKWPNDIYVGDQKIAGLLIENSIQQHVIKNSIIGIGININQIEFSANTPHACSLQQLTGRNYDRELLLAELCDALEVKYEWIRNSTKQTIQNAYLNKLFRYQQEAHFVIDDIAQTAKIVGIDGFGRLGLQLKEQVRYFNNKEISYIL